MRGTKSCLFPGIEVHEHFMKQKDCRFWPCTVAVPCSAAGCDCRAGFLPPLQGCLWVNTSVQLPTPAVCAGNKARIPNEGAGKASGQGSDPAHSCSKKTMHDGDLLSMIYST